jgi:hypothetical protein
MQRGFVPEGKDPNLPDQSEHYNVIGNNFFPTMGIRMAAGRGFGSQDTATSVKVGVINESLAHNSFPNQNPIGRRFSISTEASDGYKGRVMIQIVGVCTDTRYSSLRDEAPPQFFLPYVQRSEIGGMSYAIRTTLPLEAVIPSLRHVAQQIDPDLPLGYVRTQDQQRCSRSGCLSRFLRALACWRWRLLRLGSTESWRIRWRSGRTRSGYVWRWARSRGKCWG